MQLDLIHESIADAIGETVRHAGGAKAVAVALWPAKSAAEAHRHLLDCLNPDRPHRLNPDELAAIARMGRASGCHAVMSFLARECGYAEPVTVEPESQADAMLRDIHAQLTQITTTTPKLIAAAERLAKRIQR